MTIKLRGRIAKSFAGIMMAVAMLVPVPAFAQVPQVNKSASTGSSFYGTVFVSPDSDIQFRIECGLPQDVDELLSCRYAITDEFPGWMDPDEDSVEVYLATPGGTAYDLTERFDVFFQDSTVRAQCDMLREELPAAVMDGSKVVMEYSAHVGQMEELPADVTYGAHLTLTPENGSAKTEASDEAIVALEVVRLDIHVKDTDGAALKDEQVRLLSIDDDLAADSDEEGIARFLGIGSGPYAVEYDGVRLDATIALGITDGALDLATAGEDVTDPYVEDGGHVCGVSLMLPASASTNRTTTSTRRIMVMTLAACTTFCGALLLANGILMARRGKEQ